MEIIIGIALTIGFAFFIYKLVEKEQKKHAENIKQAKITYDSFLQLLEDHPENSTFYTAALAAGRIYYSLTLPDTATYITDRYGTREIARQSNASGRESAISNDIQARIHKKGKAS